MEEGSQAIISKKKTIVFLLLLKIDLVFKIANSADPDEMPHCVAFHLGLHCLQKYPLTASSLHRVKYSNQLESFNITVFTRIF